MNSKWIWPMMILALVCCEACCCDGQWQLHHICHGEFGIDMVFQYGYWCAPTCLVAKKWIGLRQNSKSYGGFGYFILTWNSQKTEWFTYSHLFTDQHSTLKAKTLTKAMCMKWLQGPSWWSGNECSLGVDTVFEVLNIFGIFCFYKQFINSLHGFIYCLCLSTTFV